MKYRVKSGVIIGILIAVVALIGIFSLAYTITLSNIDAQQVPMSEKDIIELDKKAIKNIIVKVEDKEYTNLDELSKNITTGSDKKVMCDVEFADGTKKEKMVGYITYGDANYAELRGNFVHIVLRR